MDSLVRHQWLHSFQFRSYLLRVELANEASCSLVIRDLVDGAGRICKRAVDFLGQMFESRIWKMKSRLKLTEWKSWNANRDRPYSSTTLVSALRIDVADT